MVVKYLQWDVGFMGRMMVSLLVLMFVLPLLMQFDCDLVLVLGAAVLVLIVSMGLTVLSFPLLVLAAILCTLLKFRPGARLVGFVLGTVLHSSSLYVADWLLEGMTLHGFWLTAAAGALLSIVQTFLTWKSYTDMRTG